MTEDYKKVSSLYHKRKSPRNLFLLNTFFLVLLIATILLPIKWYYTLVVCFVLFILYGFFRLWGLN
ncbi:hypothetical protein HY636_02020 [Candidatus Woesearchaeota archaeon]|nr:hypothetical protein [Candidatus Woesearchaeota archaeon]